ncbi:nucleotide exchange factor GrpE [Candidatus Nitrospira bockiana]
MEHKDENIHTISGFDGSEQQSNAPPSSGQGQDQDAATKDQIKEKEEELKVLQDKYLRLAAEFENYKRLAQRDQREQAKFANESVLKELLPIVDNLQRAIQFSKETTADNDSLTQGVELTLKQFLETLGRFGVKPISSRGEPFDPSRHQAVASVESTDAPPHTVLQEHQPGYLLHDRILRAAMVTVAAPPAKPNPEPEEGEHHG